MFLYLNISLHLNSIFYAIYFKWGFLYVIRNSLPVPITFYLNKQLVQALTASSIQSFKICPDHTFSIPPMCWIPLENLLAESSLTSKAVA